MFFSPLNPSNVLWQGKEVREKSECSQVAPFFPSNGLCMSCVGPLFLLFPIPLSMGNVSIMSAYGASQFISTVCVRSLEGPDCKACFPTFRGWSNGKFFFFPKEMCMYSHHPTPYLCHPKRVRVCYVSLPLPANVSKFKVYFLSIHHNPKS